jgi:hypothetical protein
MSFPEVHVCVGAVMDPMVAALFVHFLPSWRNMLAPDKLALLIQKFKQGKLDAELLEKTKSQLADLQATHFRFLKAQQFPPLR